MNTFLHIKKKILTDIKVELADEFDRNFERKGFFNTKWKARNKEDIGTLMQRTGTLRKSIHAKVGGDSVQFTSAVPYATIHNTGGTVTQKVPPHQRKRKADKKAYLVRSYTRTVTMPQRQFIGTSPEVKKACMQIIHENMKALEKSLFKNLKNK